MKTQSLPGEPDYQQLYNEAAQMAAHYEKAYFDLLARYCDTVDKYIADVDREIEKSQSTSSKRSIDPFILMKMGGKSDVAQCK